MYCLTCSGVVSASQIRSGAALMVTAFVAVKL